MENEVVKVTEEAVEAVATNTENVYVIGAVCFAIGVATAIGGCKLIALRKAKKAEQTEKVEVEE